MFSRQTGTAHSFLLLLGAALGLCLAGSAAGAQQPNAATARDALYAPAEEVCRPADDRINESSGMAASIENPGHLWLHNDSGDIARLFLIDLAGQTKAVVTLEGAEHIDWEDMASARIDGQAWLLVADVGDNLRQRSHMVLYLVQEPKLDGASAAAPASLTLRPERTIRFRFDDGPADCEAVAIDAEQRSIFLAAKVMYRRSGIYRLPFDAPAKELPSGEVAVARCEAQLDVPLVTAMDIAPDGRQMVLLTYFEALQYERTRGGLWVDALKRPPLRIGMPPRLQGETICFDRDGETLYANSEFPHQPVWALRRLPLGDDSPSAGK